MGTLHLNLPGRPKGAKVEVVGYGKFENGGSYEIKGDEDIYVPPRQEDTTVVDLNDNTVAELQELARQRDVSYSGLNKEALVEALTEEGVE